nr:hypothetical protein [Tanacetum cinerariifolium]
MSQAPKGLIQVVVLGAKKSWVDTIAQTRVESSDDEQSLGEDASKQGRISDIDVDKGITLVITYDDAEMFDADKDLHGEEVFVANQDRNVVEKEVDAAQVQVSIAAVTATISIDEDKGKAIMIKEPIKLKKKNQIMHDEEVALKLQAELQAEFDKEEQRLARETAQKEQEVNSALIEEKNDIQAKIDADYQLVERLQV